MGDIIDVEEIDGDQDDVYREVVAADTVSVTIRLRH
jgi:hypothetical protein